MKKTILIIIVILVGLSFLYQYDKEEIKSVIESNVLEYLDNPLRKAEDFLTKERDPIARGTMDGNGNTVIGRSATTITNATVGRDMIINNSEDYSTNVYNTNKSSNDSSSNNREDGDSHDDSSSNDTTTNEESTETLNRSGMYNENSSDSYSSTSGVDLPTVRNIVNDTRQVTLERVSDVKRTVKEGEVETRTSLRSNKQLSTTIAIRQRDAENNINNYMSEIRTDLSIIRTSVIRLDDNITDINLVVQNNVEKLSENAVTTLENEALASSALVDSNFTATSIHREDIENNITRIDTELVVIKTDIVTNNDDSVARDTVLETTNTELNQTIISNESETDTKFVDFRDYTDELDTNQSIALTDNTTTLSGYINAERDARILKDAENDTSREDADTLISNIVNANEVIRGDSMVTLINRLSDERIATDHVLLAIANRITNIEDADIVSDVKILNNGTDINSLSTNQSDLTDLVVSLTTRVSTLENATVVGRVGEFLFAKKGALLLVNGYLEVKAGTINAGALDHPIWAAMYPEFVFGPDVVFPAHIDGTFLRNNGGLATLQGIPQADATATNGLFTSTGGYHNHGLTVGRGGSVFSNAATSILEGNNNFSAQHSNISNISNISNTLVTFSGSHGHDIGSNDNETRPHNVAYQLYTIVDITP